MAQSKFELIVCVCVCSISWQIVNSCLMATLQVWEEVQDLPQCVNTFARFGMMQNLICVFCLMGCIKLCSRKERLAFVGISLDNILKEVRCVHDRSIQILEYVWVWAVYHYMYVFAPYFGWFSLIKINLNVIYGTTDVWIHFGLCNI